MMRKVHPCREGDDETAGYMIQCPGCKCAHLFTVAHLVRADGTARPRWEFDGNLEEPTFSPSMLVTCPAWVNIEQDGWLEYHREGDTSHRVPRGLVGEDCPATVEGVAAKLRVEASLEAVSAWVGDYLAHLPPSVCHSFVRRGFMEFLPDSTHELSGKTVELEVW